MVLASDSTPDGRGEDGHDLVAGGFAAEGAVVDALPQAVARLEEQRVRLLPVLAQAPRKQLKLELLHVVFHVQRQVEGDEKVLSRVFLRRQLGANKVDENHRKGVAGVGEVERGGKSSSSSA